MRPFKQSTVVTIRIGPALDSTGAEYTGLVIGDLTLTKAGTSAAMASAATLTHIANGHYSLVTIAGNTDTLGSLRIDCNKATYQIPPVEGEVLPATVFDAIVTNAAGGANGFLLSDANNRVDLAKWIGTAPLALSSQQVQAIVPDTQKVDVNTIKTQAVTCAAGVTVSPFVGSTGAAINGTNANTLSGHDPGETIMGATDAITVTTNNDKTGYGLSSAAVQAIWDALTSALTTAGSIGKLLVDNINATISSRLASASYTTPPTAVQNRQEMDSNSTQLSTIAGYIDTEVATIKNLAEADLFVDTSVSPWALVYMLKNTGGIGVGTELLRKRLYDVSGVAIGATTTVIGQSKQ